MRYSSIILIILCFLGIRSNAVSYESSSTQSSSPSSGASSSNEKISSSSLGETEQCTVSVKSLQKPVDYDDWVYMGKENYGSSQATKEFGVWARIIKDSDGNDVHLFVKEDKAHGLRKDSSFYWDGRWEVFEFDDAAKETRHRASSGMKSLSKYDDKERLKEYYEIDEKGDTLESQQYEWKNGRLVRMTANGIVRNYIYGKTLQDTVRVEPSDAGFNYHRGYNGTAGKIPEEGTRDYETFSLNPYGHVHFGED